MHIGLIAPPWCAVPPPTYGGTELIVALLAQEWLRTGHRVTVVACGGSEVQGELVTTFPTALGTGNGDVCLEGIHALRAYDALAGVDVIHDHSGMVGVAIAARDRSLPPVVHTLHGPWTPGSRQFYDLVHDRVHFVAISEAQRLANPGVHYAETIHNGIDLDAYPMSDRSRGDHLVFIGRANSDKNPVSAIRIARAAGRQLKIVTKRHQSVEREYWQDVVVPLLGEDIEVFEDIDHDAKVRLLQDAHAMVFPIQWPEPFGLVMIEAMACGTPVLARPTGAAREVVDHGVTGFLYENETDLVTAVGRVDALDRSACRQRVAAHFSAEQMARRYEQLLTQLTAGAEPSGRDSFPSVAAPRFSRRFAAPPIRIARRVSTTLWKGTDATSSHYNDGG